MNNEDHGFSVKNELRTVFCPRTTADTELKLKRFSLPFEYQTNVVSSWKEKKIIFPWLKGVF
jgi:hypothetical protein